MVARILLVLTLALFLNGCTQTQQEPKSMNQSTEIEESPSIRYAYIYTVGAKSHIAWSDTPAQRIQNTCIGPMAGALWDGPTPRICQGYIVETVDAETNSINMIKARYLE